MYCKNSDCVGILNPLLNLTLNNVQICNLF